MTNFVPVKRRILFICIHNTARSQMAEAFSNRICAGIFKKQSAGLAPSTLNPLGVEAMAEIDFDLSRKGTQRAADLASVGPIFDYVIGVCHDPSPEPCPIFPGATKRLHWGFRDRSTLSQRDAEKLAAVREIREQIRAQIQG